MEYTFSIQICSNLRLRLQLQMNEANQAEIKTSNVKKIEQVHKYV